MKRIYKTINHLTYIKNKKNAIIKTKKNKRTTTQYIV